MGGVCGACGGSSPHKEKYQQHQNSFQQGSQPQYRPQEKVSVPQRTTEEDRARMDEARANAAIAAQKRAEQFEKSAGGRAARTAIAQAKAPPVVSGRDDHGGLKWTGG